MGTFRSTFKPQYSAALADRAHTVPAAAKTSSPEPTPKLEPVEAPRAAAKQALNARVGRGPGRMFTKATGRAAGLRGGQARSKSLAPEKRQDIARRAAASRWGGKGAR